MNKNIVSIDYIKAFASFSVTAVHFRNRVETNISVEQLNSLTTIFFSLNYALFISAVPLFLLTTGFLTLNAKPSKKYYLKLINIYLMYIFMAIITYFIMVKLGVREYIGFRRIIKDAMSFSLISGWYIELYIGMAIFLPFYNILLASIDRKTQRNLILSLLCMVSIPVFFNKNGISNIIYIPNFYGNFYPFVYLTIGNYFRKYDECFLSVKKWGTLVLTSLVIITFIIFITADPYTITADGYYPSILQVVLSSSIFMFIRSLKNLEYNKMIKFISTYTLSTYIVSLPVDRILYPIFTKMAGGEIQTILYAPIIVIVAFFTALVSGYILQYIFNKLVSLNYLLYNKMYSKQ